MALNIVRLRPEEEYEMRRILVAKYRYYIDPTTGKVYRRGDTDMPPGCRLLVGEGSPVEPGIAEEYGLETEEAQDVARVPGAPVTAPEDRSLGASAQAEAGYRRIEETGAIHRELQPRIERAGQSGAGAAAQLGLHAETMVAAATQRAGEEEPGARALARQQMGAQAGGGEASAEIVRRLEAGEREALATHKAQIDTRAEEIKKEIKGEPAGDEPDETRADPTGGSNEAPGGASTPVSGSASGAGESNAPTSSSRTREIKPAGSSSKRARGGSKGGAKGGSKGSTAG